MPPVFQDPGPQSKTRPGISLTVAVEDGAGPDDGKGVAIEIDPVEGGDPVFIEVFDVAVTGHGGVVLGYEGVVDLGQEIRGQDIVGIADDVGVVVFF